MALSHQHVFISYHGDITVYWRLRHGIAIITLAVTTIYALPPAVGYDVAVALLSYTSRWRYGYHAPILRYRRFIAGHHHNKKALLLLWLLAHTPYRFVTIAVDIIEQHY